MFIDDSDVETNCFRHGRLGNTNDNNDRNAKKINQTEEATKTSKAYTESAEETMNDDKDEGENAGADKKTENNQGTNGTADLKGDALKKALGLNHVRDSEDTRDDINDDFNSSSDATRDSSFADNNTNSSSNTTDNNDNSSTKGLPGEKCLPDKYVCDGSPSKLMMVALKELNVNDIQDFLMAGGPEETEQFEKKKRVPSPQYHLESSCGDFNGQLMTYQLQSYFGGRHLKDLDLLSKLGTGVSVVDSDQDIPTIGELVN